MKCPKCGRDTFHLYPEEGIAFRVWLCSHCGNEEKVNRLKDWDEAPYLVGTTYIESTKIEPKRKRDTKVK